MSTLERSTCSWISRPACTAAVVALSFVLASCSNSLALSSAQPEPRTQKPRSPNIVVILSDDLGWGDVGYHGSDIKTPTLDGLAKRGVELDRYYTYAVCSPTRAALMTGRSSLETGVDGPLAFKETLPLNLTLLPQHLKGLNYQTVMIGKWHLGKSKPEEMPFKRGFDYFYGFLGGFINKYSHIDVTGAPDWQRNGQALIEAGHTTDLMTEDAIRQIKGRDKTKPLFMYLAYDAPHTPLQAPDEYVARNTHIADPGRRMYAAMVEHMDAQLARVMSTLEAEGMAQDTLVVWASDNGPLANGSGSTGGLRGSKSTVFEGGQRVPAFAFWPGQLEGGRKLNAPVTVLDWFPTLIRVAGGTPPTDPMLPGRDVMPVLRGAAQAPGADMVLGNHMLRVKGYAESAYRFPWKLVRMPAPAPAGAASSPQATAAKVELLFNLETDPKEATNVAAAHPDIVKRLLADLEAAPRAPRTLSLWPIAPGAVPH